MSLMGCFAFRALVLSAITYLQFVQEAPTGILTEQCLLEIDTDLKLNDVDVDATE